LAIAMRPATAAAESFWRGPMEIEDKRRAELRREIRSLLADPAVGGDRTARILSLVATLETLTPHDPDLPVWRAEALESRGRDEEAALVLERARAVTTSRETESHLSMVIAQRKARRGNYEAASADLLRHLRLLKTPDPNAWVWLGAVRLAEEKLDAAEESFMGALALLPSTGPTRMETAARANFGMALVRDLSARPADSFVARALVADATRSLLRQACDGHSELPFLLDAHARHLCALADRSMGNTVRAREGFARAALAAPTLKLRERAAFHAQQMGEQEQPATPWRLVAVAARGTRGPIPAPLVDAAFRGRSMVFERCLAAADPNMAAPVRLRLEVTFAGDGHVLAADPQGDLPEHVGKLAGCLATRTVAAIRAAGMSSRRPTTCNVEFLIGRESVRK
jgi:tetratricopeptide (TPR) repeat protein